MTSNGLLKKRLCFTNVSQKKIQNSADEKITII